MQREGRIARLPFPEQRGWPDRFGAGAGERDAILRLAHLRSVPPGNLRALAWREGTARGCVRAVLAGGASDADRRRVDRVDPGSIRAVLRSVGARLVVPGDPEYAPALLDLADPPGWLFVRGRGLTQLGPVAMAIVGARSCSIYGREVATWIGRGVAAAGVTVVSGAARGIDAAAHRGALAAGGPTVAVLGSGIDVPYPAVHRRLLEEIAASGAIVSEYPPATRASKHLFPARNRIVAALARAVLIVEGAPGSGSMISADFAEQLGREVMAVPGPVTSPLSAVPHDLLRQGAALIRQPSDVLEVLGLPPEGFGTAGRDLPPEERAVLDALVGEAVTVESVSRASGLPAAAALSALMALELRGLVRSAGGRYGRSTAATEAR